MVAVPRSHLSSHVTDKGTEINDLVQVKGQASGQVTGQRSEVSDWTDQLVVAWPGSRFLATLQADPLCRVLVGKA